MAKKDQESQEKQVLTEWQKRNLEFLRKKETEDSEEFASGKVVHSQEATSNESQPPVKKKVKKKKKTKRKKRKKGNTTSNIPIAQQNLAGLVVFIAALLIVFSLFFISPWSKQKVLTVSGTKNALPEDVKVASGILDTDYITHVFFNQGKVASTVEKTNVWVKKATVTYSFPNQFNIAVKEYPIVAYRQTTNGYVSILQSGKTGGTVSTSNLPDKFITLKMDDEKKIEELVKELNKLDTKIKNNIQIINLTPTKATSDLLTIELYDGNSIRVPLSQLTVKLPYYEKIKNQLSDGSIVDMEVGQIVDVHLKPEEAYGLPDPNAVFTLEIAQLPGSEDLTVGQKVYLSNQYGQPFPVKVLAKEEKTITFDANHEMAGKELNFTIELVEVK